MGAPLRHLLSQGPVLAGLAAVGWKAAFGQRPQGPGPRLPTDPITATVPARSAALIADYRRWLGGDAKRDADHVPPHLFPQWGFPLLARTLDGLPYPLTKVLNQGCRLTVRGPLRSGVPLNLSARLVDLREEPGKARIHQQLITGTDESPDALVADIFAVVPLPRAPGEARSPRSPPVVPVDATERAERRFKSGAGRDFAVLTGDVNPIHVSALAARAAGFRSCILHGFATMGWAWEQTIRHRLAGDVHRVHIFDVRFTKPLVLPATARLYSFPSDGADPSVEGLGVAAAPGGPAWMLGSVTTRPPRSP